MENQIEPSAIWSTRNQIFDKKISNTQNIIMSQGRFALSAMLDKISELYECLHATPQMSGMYPHPRIPQILSEICIHQGIASSVLFDKPKRDNEKSAAAYKLKLERFEYIKNICETNFIPVPILSNRKMRNELIHIDEYLFKNLRKPDTGWFIDVAIDSREQFKNPNIKHYGFCRSFIASEEIIIHFDNEISIPKLWHEATAVLAAAFGTPPKEQPLLPANILRILQTEPPQTEA